MDSGQDRLLQFDRDLLSGKNICSSEGIFVNFPPSLKKPFQMKGLGLIICRQGNFQFSLNQKKHFAGAGESLFIPEDGEFQVLQESEDMEVRILIYQIEPIRDGVWYNTKFNRNYVINGLIGKEWMLGRNKQNILSVNLKLTLQGGDRYSPIDLEATMNHPDKEVQYDETKAFSKQYSPMLIGNYTVSYRINKRKVSHEFAVKGLNFTGAKEHYGHEYNVKTGKIDVSDNSTILTNVSYKLEF